MNWSNLSLPIFPPEPELQKTFVFRSIKRKVTIIAINSLGAPDRKVSL